MWGHWKFGEDLRSTWVGPPMSLESKIIYREVCCSKLPWDAELVDPY